MFGTVIPRAVETTKKLLLKSPPPAKCLTFEDELSLSKIKPAKEDANIVEMLLEFRNNHAKIIDEPPSEIFTFQEAVSFVKKI